MNTRNLFIILISTCFITSCSSNKIENKQPEEPKQDVLMDNFSISPETAHPKAKKLLTEDFYWSPIEETGPFGSDAGSDAFYGFREWRLTHPSSSPLDFFEELMNSWGIPRFDMYELDVDKINKFIHTKTEIDDSEKNKQIKVLKDYYKSVGQEIPDDTLKSIMNQVGNNINGDFLIEQDNALIAIGFGQFVLEGKIDEDVQDLTKITIRRQLLPILLERFTPNYIDTRKDQLNKMLKVVDRMND